MHNAKGTDKMIGLKNSVAGCMIALCAKAKAFRVKDSQKAKTEDNAKVIINLISKVLLLFHDPLLLKLWIKQNLRPPIAIPNEEIKR
jgi:hypothetical protein